MTNWITVDDSLKGRALAVERERERIIKLLEQARDLEKTGIASWLGLQSAIMLIKGETNG